MATFEELVETLTDEKASSYSQQRAVIGLGRLGEERAIDPLVSALKNEDRYVRREAAKALGELGFPNAIEPLIGALGDSEEYVRRNAITALGLIGDERAVKPLRQILEDKSYFTRNEAEKSLRAIAGRLEESTATEDVDEQEPELSPVLSAEPEVVEETPPVQDDITDEGLEEPLVLPVARPVKKIEEPIHTRREEPRREHTFTPRVGRAKQNTRAEQIADEIVDRYKGDRKNRTSPANKPRGIIIAVIVAVFALRIMSKSVPFFLIPMVLAIGALVLFQVVKQRK